jgi:hypothetical protein
MSHIRDNFKAEAESVLVEAMRRAEWASLQAGSISMQMAGLQQQMTVLNQEASQASKDVEEARSVVQALGGNAYPSTV